MVRIGRQERHRLGERYGIADRNRPQGKLLWLHGAGVGEGLSLLPLIEAIRKECPGLHLLVTSCSKSSALVSAKSLKPQDTHQYLPLDTRDAVQAFVDHWQPNGGVIVESELWPNLVIQMKAKGVKLFLLNARLSPASTRRWRRYAPALATAMFSSFDSIKAQSLQDAKRIEGFGITGVSTMPNLKFMAAPLDFDSARKEQLQSQWRNRMIWLIASSHSPEEEWFATTAQRVRAAFPSALCILAPRGPERGNALARRLREIGLRIAQHSKGEEVKDTTDLYLADSIGEMGLWFALAPLVVMAGSFLYKGGHNLLEPLRFGCHVVTGPHMENLKEITQAALDSQVIQQVQGSSAKPNALQENLIEVLQATITEKSPLTRSPEALAFTKGRERQFDEVVREICQHLQ